MTSSDYFNKYLQVQEFEVIGQKRIELSILWCFLIAKPSLLAYFIIDFEIMADFENQIICSYD